MEEDGKLVGQIAFVKSYVKLDDETHLPSLTLGPLEIHPEYQHLGYGKHC